MATPSPPPPMYRSRPPPPNVKLVVQPLLVKDVIPRAHAQEYRMQYVGLGTTKIYFSRLSFRKVLSRLNS